MRNFQRIVAELQEERSRVQRELNRLENAIVAIRSLTGRNHKAAAHGARWPRSRLSVAARKRIAAAQRARWAKIRQSKAATK